MSNKPGIFWIIGLIIISPMLFIMLFLSLRIWPLWLLLIVIASVFFFLKRNKSPEDNEVPGKISAGLNNLLYRLNFFINSVSFKNITRKLFLYPLIAIASIVILGFIIEFIGQDYFKSRRTKKEMVEITEALNKYKYHLDNYPEDLDKLIGNNPLRREWLSDEWNQNYRYNVATDGQNFSLISQGKDSQERTSDDLVFNKNSEVRP
jgi:hypothetical protein